MAAILKKLIVTSPPFAGVLTSSLMIAWATEVASFFLSRGLAFALLALIQVLPEFAVEAVITAEAGRTLSSDAMALVTANFTGANRLLVGLFLPIVFFFHARHVRRSGAGGPANEVRLPVESSLEIVALLVPTLYSFAFAFRGSISLFDAAVLTAMYIAYLVMAYRLPSEAEDPSHLPGIPRWIMGRPARVRTGLTLGLFLGGGLLLFLSVEPFYHNTIGLAVAVGVPAYFLFQWIAPLLSEFPELITVSYWGKTGRATLGVTNLVSSKINQWTLLIAMLPVVFGYVTWQQHGQWFAISLDNPQQVEVLITAAQGLFAVACLMGLRFKRWHAWALMVLWAIQAADPLIDPFLEGWLPSPFPSSLRSGELVREWFTLLYLVLTGYVLWVDRHRLAALPGVRRVWREHIRPGAPRAPGAMSNE